MGLIARLIGGPAAVTALGSAARGMAEVLTPNATRAMALSAEAQMAALRQLGAEYADPGFGWFDRFVNGLNRLPRPMLAFGTLGLFVYAMADPTGFARRMVGLNHVPEPLWWLLGAVVGFYFGAREAFHYRQRSTVAAVAGMAATAPDAMPETNPALADWRSVRG
ncbi:holin family protein [Szabonella alba]|uniref:Holin family protein n=1 Tax=Szabonella alba TaxID=2804194 RepID=A0A8K0Y1E8_9RHOB|nr:holin family protein [Szabonella alba]MBL4917807.1 holin family protein [Szabonella alba]